MTTRHLPRRALSCVLLLGAALVCLRLGHLIDWPWRLVLFPWAAVLAAAVIYLLILLVGGFLVEWRSARDNRRHRNRNTFRLRP